MEKIVKEASIHVAQFREVLIQIGQKKGGGDTGEIVRIQRKTTVDNCRQACSILIAKKTTHPAEQINKQLDLLSSCTKWLLDEMKKCAILMEALPTLENNPTLNPVEFSSLAIDMDEAKKLLGDIEIHKMQVPINLPKVSANETAIEIEMSDFRASSSTGQKRKLKQRREKDSRPKTKYNFPIK